MRKNLKGPVKTRTGIPKLVAAVVIPAAASAFGIARDYGYLRSSILTGSPGGQCHALATRLADRAKREHGAAFSATIVGPQEGDHRLAPLRSF